MNEDREVFLAYLREACQRFGLTVEGYCLLGNHVHLTEPDDEEAIRRLRLWPSRGRPLASDSFVSKLETLLGRRLRPRLAPDRK